MSMHGVGGALAIFHLFMLSICAYMYAFELHAFVHMFGSFCISYHRYYRPLLRV